MAEGEEFIQLCCLGKGGFGEVFKVKSKKDGKTYALKKIKLLQGPLDVFSLMKSFVKEVSFLNNINHPNIVKFYSAMYGAELKLAIQMEFCERGDMDSLITSRNGRRFYSTIMQKWMLQLSSAISFIHSKDIMHRDLKPGNILLDTDFNIKICDFGIAKVVLQTCGQTQIGTPVFMAPEAFTGTYNKEADIYSLGCVFICMATLNRNPKNAVGGFVDLPPKLTYGKTKTSIFRSCVLAERTERPTAAELHSTLANDKYETLRFHEECSQNIGLSLNRLVGGQKDPNRHTGMLFSNRRLNPNEKFCLLIRKVRKLEESTFSFVFTKLDPSNLSRDFLAVDSPSRRHFKENSFFCCCKEHFKENSKLSFWYDECGNVLSKYDGQVSVSRRLMPGSIRPWVMLLLIDHIQEVQLADYE